MNRFCNRHQQMRYCQSNDDRHKDHYVLKLFHEIGPLFHLGESGIS